MRPPHGAAGDSLPLRGRSATALFFAAFLDFAGCRAVSLFSHAFAISSSEFRVFQAEFRRFFARGADFPEENACHARCPLLSADDASARTTTASPLAVHLPLDRRSV